MKEHCPFCQAVLDEVAILTNVCTECSQVLGDIGQTIRTVVIDPALVPITDEEAQEAKSANALTSSFSGLFDTDTDSFSYDTDVTDTTENNLPRAPQTSLSKRLFKEAGANKEEEQDYILLKKIGAGGMGEIHEVTQCSLGRAVAIKVLRSGRNEHTDDKQKFRSEAAITGNLEHPNIVPIYDMGLDNEGEVFYAMKRVHGTPWSEALEAKSLQENIDILLHVCDGIAFAHSKGIIHRDIKPENIMLGEFGEVLIMDWGLAAGMHEDAPAPRVTYRDAIAGTPAYMAPEMARGEEDNISFSSDIYLLGATLFEIVTGQQPHTGGNIRECLSNAAKNIISEPWLNSELLKTAMKAMSTDRADRYINVREFQESIRKHYRSVELSTKARKHLVNAQKKSSYHDFFQALSGFNEALEIWPGNEDAFNHLLQTVEKFATLAQDNGDNFLAERLLDETANINSEMQKKIRETLSQNRETK